MNQAQNSVSELFNKALVALEKEHRSISIKRGLALKKASEVKQKTVVIK